MIAMVPSPSSLRDIVVHVDDDTLSSQALTFAARIAHDTGARVRALLALPRATGLGPLGAESAALAAHASRELLVARRAVAEDLVARVNAAFAVTITLESRAGHPTTELQLAARCADLLVVSQSRSRQSGGLDPTEITRLVMGAGCPVVVVPHIGWQGDATFPVSTFAPATGPAIRRVLGAWSGTRESSRALRDALPLLSCVDVVELVSAPPAGAGPGAETSLQSAVTWLRHHGLACEGRTLALGDRGSGQSAGSGWIPDVSVGEALLSHAADIQADLLVMGAYGHARLWEFVLGGVTRTILGSMTVPVLLSH
jgi:nucleotide-binding universal stress UspA family protein